MAYTDIAASFGDDGKPMAANVAQLLCYDNLRQLYDVSGRALWCQAWQSAQVTREAASFGFVAFCPGVLVCPDDDLQGPRDLRWYVYGSGPSGAQARLSVMPGPRASGSAHLRSTVNLPASSAWVGPTTLTMARRHVRPQRVQYPTASPPESQYLSLAWLWLELLSDGVSAAEVRSILVEEIP